MTQNNQSLRDILKQYWKLAQASPPYPWSYDLIANQEATAAIEAAVVEIIGSDELEPMSTNGRVRQELKNRQRARLQDWIGKGE